GEKWAYSNTGYVLLATVVKRVSGMPFEKFLQEHIFDPAEMKDTSIYSYVKGNDPKMPMRVFGFAQKGGKSVSNDTHFLNFAKGDGGVYSTLEDLYKWDRILYTDELVSEETMDTIFSPAKLNDGKTFDYGYGWFIENTPSGEQIVYHGGGWVGFGTYIYRNTTNNSGFIILTNNSNYEGLEEVFQGMKSMMRNRSE
ncbi:MAG: serine hydrolase domain-containing protein, partial [Pricia sp.]